jgi:hypothetical protein
VIRLAQLAAIAVILAIALPAQGLDRRVSVVAAAIKLSGPSLPASTRLAYARTIRRDAIRYRFDPLTLIAMVHFESHWIASTINDHRSGYYVGLGQINAIRAHSPCNRRELIGTEACAPRLAALLDPHENLRRAAVGIHLNRKRCREITGKPALFARWLSSYQGLNNYAAGGRAGVWCNMKQDRRGRWRDVPVHRLTRQVMRYRLELIRRLGL